MTGGTGIEPANGKAGTPARRAAGYSVHVLTASGGAVGVLALDAAVGGRFPETFAWLGLALFIDGIDGTLARAAKVKETAAYVDGDILDLVVDFLTYVIVPVIAIWRSGLLAPGTGRWIGLVITVASAIYFADTRMKTKDNWFRGFPALWNVAALYLFAFRPNPVTTATVLLALTALMFAPIVFVHPLRVQKLRNATIAVSVAWFLCAAAAIASGFETGFPVKVGLALCAVYFVALPFLRHSPFSEE
ncbi:MAG: phosphatidylcholine synthase [Hyphomicrobiales bacterium]|nr:phosphatidylcholine synthase [Hyphomicrobiales bacterium]